MLILKLYLIAINILALAVMAEDKRRAVNHRWRIRERTLFLLAIAGGSVGSLVGMYLLRHKTRHIQFVLGMPAILAVQILLYFLLK